jgi:hypothetical protein
MIILSVCVSLCFAVFVNSRVSISSTTIDSLNEIVVVDGAVGMRAACRSGGPGSILGPGQISVEKLALFCNPASGVTLQLASAAIALRSWITKFE